MIAKLSALQYSLETFHRSNQDTSLIHKPSVSEGDWVQPGDLLADCSASAGGELALGHNIVVAYMPWEGYNFEDAILISEKLVYDDVFTSIHIERYEIETRDTKFGTEKITRELPDVAAEDVNHLDNCGIAKIGSWIEEGDILVGKITPLPEQVQSPSQKFLYKLLDKKFHPVRDSSLRAPKSIKSKVIKTEICNFAPISVLHNRQASLKRSLKSKKKVASTEARLYPFNLNNNLQNKRITKVDPYTFSPIKSLALAKPALASLKQLISSGDSAPKSRPTKGTGIKKAFGSFFGIACSKREARAAKLPSVEFLGSSFFLSLGTSKSNNQKLPSVELGKVTFYKKLQLPVFIDKLKLRKKICYFSTKIYQQLYRKRSGLFLSKSPAKVNSVAVNYSRLYSTYPLANIRGYGHNPPSEGIGLVDSFWVSQIDNLEPIKYAPQKNESPGFLPDLRLAAINHGKERQVQSIKLTNKLFDRVQEHYTYNQLSKKTGSPSRLLRASFGGDKQFLDWQRQSNTARKQILNKCFNFYRDLTAIACSKREATLGSLLFYTLKKESKSIFKSALPILSFWGASSNSFATRNQSKSVLPVLASFFGSSLAQEEKQGSRTGSQSTPPLPYLLRSTARKKQRKTHEKEQGSIKQESKQVIIPYGISLGLQSKQRPVIGWLDPSSRNLASLVAKPLGKLRGYKPSDSFATTTEPMEIVGKEEKKETLKNSQSFAFSRKGREILSSHLLKGPTKEKSKLKIKCVPIKIQVYLAEKRKIQVGDKMAGRHGNKGIISQILPRQDMPYLPDGTAVDIVLNPLGVPSRMNVGQIYECLLGLAGKYLGQHFKIFPFDEIYGPEASRSFVYNKLYEAQQKTGLKWLFNANSPGKIRLFDGRTGDSFEQPITVGRAYMLKLVHMVDDKIHARSTGPYSLVTQQPLRGRSKQGGQRLGEMEVWAIEGYGAAFTLLEMLTIKSDDLTGRVLLWHNLIFNKEITIGTPESFKVLVSELQALCLDIGLFKY